MKKGKNGQFGRKLMAYGLSGALTIGSLFGLTSCDEFSLVEDVSSDSGVVSGETNENGEVITSAMTSVDVAPVYAELSAYGREIQNYLDIAAKEREKLVYSRDMDPEQAANMITSITNHTNAAGKTLVNCEKILYGLMLEGGLTDEDKLGLTETVLSYQGWIDESVKKSSEAVNSFQLQATASADLYYAIEKPVGEFAKAEGINWARTILRNTFDDYKSTTMYSLDQDGFKSEEVPGLYFSPSGKYVSSLDESAEEEAEAMLDALQAIYYWDNEGIDFMWGHTAVVNDRSYDLYPNENPNDKQNEHMALNRIEIHAGMIVYKFHDGTAEGFMDAARANAAETTASETEVSTEDELEA